MGILLGLLLGLGLILIIQAFVRPAQKPERTSHTVSERMEELLAQAGIDAVTPNQLLFSCLGVGFTVFLIFFAVSRAIVVGATFALMAAYIPLMLVRYRARSRRQELRDLWPDVVDNLASSVRAGLSLAEGLTQIGVRGPEPLRKPFQRFAEDYRATGRFNDCLDRLKRQLADPVGDRIIESLRIAREVGGSDLGRLLRTLSGFLREDARTRAELESRQAFTVNSARLAVAAPWFVLAFMSLNPDTASAYNTPGGVVVIIIGGALCVLAYRLMVRIGRLPEEKRVLR